MTPDLRVIKISFFIILMSCVSLGKPLPFHWASVSPSVQADLGPNGFKTLLALTLRSSSEFREIKKMYTEPQDVF
jgi:hypothetical protein